MKRLVALVLVLFLPTLSIASGMGFDPKRLANAQKVLNKLVEDKKLAGGVLLVLRDGKPAFEHVFGYSDKEAGKKMERDTIFRIASQTKAVTSVAALVLVEEGKLAINDPVSKYIPSFAKTTVRAADGEIAAANREITILDLLTHTSGISYGREPEVFEVYKQNKLTLTNEPGDFFLVLVGEDDTICNAMARLSKLPFVAQPGDMFVYGFNTDVLSCVIERASGMALDRFVSERITKPLKMKDTEFYLSEGKDSRLAAVYRYGSNGEIERAPNDNRGQGPFVEGHRKMFSGGAGLLSTAHDYARFLEMLRRGGELDGVRVLSPRSVALMNNNQIGASYKKPGLGFGLGFEVVERYGADGMLSVGTFGWAGAYGSTYRVDPKHRLSIVFMAQQLPNLNTTEIKKLVYTQVYQALLDPL